MTWLTTFTGKEFDYLEPTVDSICIEDIAKGLSHECRFAGQINQFYSVAQHCVECSYIVPAQFALEALLHDATEAYCKDIPSPLKWLLDDYKKIERNLDRIIRNKFGLSIFESKEVKHADLVMLATERRDLLPNDGKEWPILRDIECLDRTITPLPSTVAFIRFQRRFEELTKENL